MHRGRGQAFCGSGGGKAMEEEDHRKTGNLPSFPIYAKLVKSVKFSIFS